MYRGYISLWRKIQDHPFYQEKREFSKFEAWVDLLMEANHKDQSSIMGNQIIECKRGQSTKSLQTWQQRWGWKSKYKVREFFMLLKNLQQITYENLTKTIRITICNYDNYQTSETNKKTLGKRRENATKTHAKPNNNDNNDNNDNNENNGYIHVKDFVKLKSKETEKLKQELGEPIYNRCLEILDNYKGSIGKKYKDDYRAIRNWVIEKAKLEERKTQTDGPSGFDVEAIKKAGGTGF